MWEYEVHTEKDVPMPMYNKEGQIKVQEFGDYLNQRGTEQWEFVSYIPTGIKQITTDLFVFKRPVED
jgi:hypothetical protein